MRSRDLFSQYTVAHLEDPSSIEFNLKNGYVVNVLDLKALESVQVCVEIHMTIGGKAIAIRITTPYVREPQVLLAVALRATDRSILILNDPKLTVG